MNKTRRILAILLIVLLSLSIFPVNALAANTVDVDTREEPTEYFEYHNDSGWHSLDTPYHYVDGSSPEIVAYCLQHAKNSPHGSATEYDPTTKYSAKTRLGLQIILERGYPNGSGGLSSSQARYATANAVRFWLSEQTGSPNGSFYGFTNLKDHPGQVRSKGTSSADAVWDFAIDLLNLARAQQKLTHSVKFTPSNITLVQDGTGTFFEGTTKATLTNMHGGYTLDKTKLPTGSIVEGFTGDSGDILTIKIPAAPQNAGKKITLTAKGYDDRVAANYAYYTPSDSDEQDVVLVGKGMEIAASKDLNMTTDALGNLEIVKVGSDGGSQEGAVFELYDSDNVLVDTLTIGADGKAICSDLPAGDYRLVEIQAKVNYLLNTNNVNVPVISSQTTTANIIDQRGEGIIQLYKSNSNPSMGNYSLGGAVFEVRDSDNAIVDTIITNVSGYGESKKLPIGHTYTVKEKTAPSKMVLNPTTYTVALGYEDQYTPIAYERVDIPEKPQVSKITVTKADKDTADKAQGDATLTGATFGIYTTSGILIETLQCPANSRSVQSGELPIETDYILKEITPPRGYTLSQKEYPFRIAYAEQNEEIALLSETVENKVVEGKISVIKFASKPLTGEPEQGNENIKEPLKDVEFEVKLILSGEVLDKIKTDENGFGISKLLPYGEYIVTELPSAANEGRKLVAPFKVSVSAENRTYPFILENDTIELNLKIVKVDAESGKVIPLAGAKFQIKDSSGDIVKQHIQYPQPVTLDIFETDGSGTLTLPEPLPYGKYTLHELESPYSYLLNENAIPFEIKDQAAQTLVAECTDSPAKGTITIEKQGEMLVGAKESDTKYGKLRVPVYKKQGLAGIEFDVIAKYDIKTPDGIVHAKKGDVIDTIITGSDSKAKTKELYLGTYIVKEKKTIEPFVLDKSEYEVTLEYKDQHTPIVSESLKLINERQKVCINLQKHAEIFTPSTCEFSYINGDGFIFGLFADEDIRGADGSVVLSKNDLLGIMETNAQGIAEISKEIPLGKFYVKELAAKNADYELSDTKYHIEAKYARDKVHEISVDVNDNKPIKNKLHKKQIRVIKTDARDNNRPLEGSIFEIRTKDGIVVTTLKTNKEGIATSLPLPYSKDGYQINEVTPPTGFKLEDKVDVIKINEDSPDIVVYSRTNAPNEVTLNKTDITDGKPIPGAKIEIFQSDGTLYYTGLTSEAGTITMAEIPAGTYTFFESYCPAQFVINQTQFSFTVDAYGSITGQTGITDEPTKLTVYKADSYTKNPMAVAFRLLDPDNNPIKLIQRDDGSYVPNDDGKAEFVTGIDGKASILYLPKANYTLVEVPQAGYAALSPVKFSLTDENGISNPFSVEIYNVPLAFHLCKVHAKTDKPVTGAGFEIKQKDGFLGLGFKTLHFTKQKDGSFRYDPKGKDTTLMVNSKGEMLISHIPKGNYWLEEKVVPKGFFPAPPMKISVKDENTIDVPLSVKVPNSPFVKLGLDTDKYDILIAIGVVIILMGGVSFFAIRTFRKRKQSK